MNDVSEDGAIFVVKTTANQERAVANLIEKVAKKEHLNIRAILAPDELRGYILVEAEARRSWSRSSRRCPMRARW